MDVYLDVNDALLTHAPRCAWAASVPSFFVELKAGTSPLDAFIDRFVAELAGRQN